ncbi:hypothetical protein IEQ34_000196 [Dendrobium chrysotoxum]|uniref:Uncharacterized protein n=1 Tax=Dendrobium chrysotoxum TaxID=161865 RepID=A0AAV7HQV5_DENCH|nr:hypothetical protein IEQ34_000196 [Dendrobium chrysotoxum]
MQIRLDILYDLLEWQLSYQQLDTLLVLANLSQSDSSRAVMMGLLNSSGGRSRLPRSLRGQLHSRSLASGLLLSSLLRTSHRRVANSYWGSSLPLSSDEKVKNSEKK